MASGTSRSVPQPPPAPAMPSARRVTSRTKNQAGGDAFIERQIRRTRRQVKLVDLVTALMLLMAGVLGYLLLVTLIDHWVLGLNTWARVIAFGTLVLGCIYYVVVAIWPLISRPINPLYAARSIEQGAPALKNSLINFLLFRTHRTEVHEAVYRTLEQKAANDLASIPIDQTVDRSRLIKIGYVLAGVLAACALYAIVSPKNAFQSVARVAAPWQEISRPSRVEITRVEPGDVEVFQGRNVAVSAEVSGANDEEGAVRLVYSSLDGQTIDHEVTMRLSSSGLTYEAPLPDGDGGVQQDLVYRIEAGDAQSPTYRVTVSPAPVILVEQVDYEFPKYTRRSPETTERGGDIRALEGTRVTIRARANQPIGSAFIEFDALPAAGPTGSGDQTVAAKGDLGRRRPLRKPMTIDDRMASFQFVLQLNDDRSTPRHASYQLGFETPDGHASEQPVVHQIQVIPDLAPEVAILTPTRERIEVREDRSQRIEVRALDPDFGLSKIHLHGVAGDEVVLDQVLFDVPIGQSGQTVVDYEFVPANLGLTAGTQVTYWAAASDNRTAVGTGEADPNTERTRNYVIEITPAPTEPAGVPPESPDGEASEGEGGAGGDEKASSEGGDEGDGETSSEDGESRPGESGGGDASEGANGTQQGDSGESREGEDGSEGSGGQPQSSGSSAGESGDGNQSGGGQSQTDGERGESGSAGASEGQSGRESPHDGEVFEKALERMKQQRNEGDRGGQSAAEDGPSDGVNEAGGASGDEAAGSDANDPGKEESGSPQTGDASSEPRGRKAEGTRSDDGTSPGSTPMGDEAPFAEGGPQENSQSQDAQQQTPRPDGAQGAGQQRDAAPGEGGQSSKKTGAEANRAEKPQPPGDRDNREKDPGSGDNGDSGAGQNSRDTTGSGSVEQAGDQTSPNRDRKKTSQPDSTQPQEESDPGTTTSKRQSDSTGDQSGDQSGGGKKGPGQGANQAGNDSAGQNNASDDGAGAAKEAGDGETSSAPGDKQTADGKTGSAGSEKGDGSTSQSNPTGSQPRDGTPQPQRDPNSPPEKDPAAGSGGEGSGTSGLPTGGGVPSDNSRSSYSGPMDVADGEEGNLEYARQVTDMVLDYLRDQQDEPDAELMKDLGWDKDDLDSFLTRWESLRRSAGEEGAEGRRELDDSLRSLGLRKQRDRLRQGAAENDNQRGLSESGVDSQPPAEYRDLFKAFRKGTSRAKPRP